MGQVVKIVCFTNKVKQTVIESVEILNSCQAKFIFQTKAEITSIPPPDMGKVYSWRLLEEILFKEKEKLSAEYLFGVLDEAIEDNWYSRTIHSKNICFIITKNWEYLSNLPVTSFVA